MPSTWKTKPKKPSQKHLLPWGYDAPVKDTISLLDYVNIITNHELRPAVPGRVKNTLVYWDRGGLTTGDEAKMMEMQINT
jgi:hypothetical protein